MGLIANPTIPDELCTYATCSLLQAHFQYIINLGGNAFYLAGFSLLIILHIFFGVRYRIWGFLVGMYLICLTIGPAFISASIYLCLARIVVVYGEHLSRIRPAIYIITFIACDFLSLLLQAAGGAIASGANTYQQDQNGIHIMIAGLSVQVASLLLFMTLCGEFAWRVYKQRGDIIAHNAPLRESRRFEGFLIALGLATFCIFIRSVFRVAELSQGFHGKLANQQVTFMILEGAMIVIATSALTIFHPGFTFAGHWGEADFTLRKRSKEMTTSASSFETSPPAEEVVDESKIAGTN